jgi:hypothetical protein
MSAILRDRELRDLIEHVAEACDALDGALFVEDLSSEAHALIDDADCTLEWVAEYPVQLREASRPIWRADREAYPSGRAQTLHRCHPSNLLKPERRHTMVFYDYSDAPPPRDFELILPNTVATMSLHILGGGAGEDGALKRSKNGRCEMLALEITLLDGEFAKRKIFENWTVEGVDHAKAIEISRSRIKAVLDSALGLDPKDVSPQARAARTRSYKELEGLALLWQILSGVGIPKSVFQ